MKDRANNQIEIDGKTYEIAFQIERGEFRVLRIWEIKKQGFRPVKFEEIFDEPGSGTGKAACYDMIMNQYLERAQEAISECEQYTAEADGGEAVIRVDGVDIRVHIGSDGPVHFLLTDSPRYLESCIGEFTTNFRIAHAKEISVLKHDCNPDIAVRVLSDCSIEVLSGLDNQVIIGWTK